MEKDLIKSKVALIRCENYREQTVYEAVKRGIDLLGGITSFVKSGEKIVLKPNLLWGMNPDKCVTTHPSVFKAVVKLLLAAGVKVTYGDSPGFGSSDFHMKAAGLKQAGDELGISMADFDRGKEVSHKDGVLVKKFVFANGVLEADGLISLPKLKSHGLTRMTGAIKNQFGTIPGMLKSQFHFKLPDIEKFAAMLVDINTFIKPRLFIMDAVIAMEGNGPRNGKPRAMNMLLFSTDPIALDAVACKTIGLNPEYVPTSRAGEKAGLGTYHYEKIEIVGDPVEDFITPDFIVTRKPCTVVHGKRIFRNLLKNQLTGKPVINLKVCNACGTCLKVCPVGEPALSFSRELEDHPQHHYDHCIRCYCCQEMCPQGAITTEYPLLAKIFFRK